MDDDLELLRHHGDREVRPGDADHAVNVLAGPPPDWLTAALAGVDLARYPDPRPAQAALAAMHGRDPEEVVITNGAAEALWLLGPAFRPARAVLVPPGFTETEVALRRHGVTVERLPGDGVSGLPALPTRQVVNQSVANRAVGNRLVVNNPHSRDADGTHELRVWTNPTSPDGRLRRPEEILEAARPGRVLVVDEAFMSMVPGEPGSLSGNRREDLVVVRSFTKLLGVPGLRVGYVLAAAPLATRLRAVQPPWSANALALAALLAAAARPGALAKRAMRASAERTDLEGRLAALVADGSIEVAPSVTNYVLIRVPDGPRVLAGLRAEGIAVRPCQSFPGYGPDHLRLTARDAAANARLVAALADALCQRDRTGQPPH